MVLIPSEMLAQFVRVGSGGNIDAGSDGFESRIMLKESTIGRSASSHRPSISSCRRRQS